MSLILDALRKSEAERRRGSPPALALELPPAPPRAVPARGWWLAVPAVLAALAVLAVASWLTRPADTPTVQATAPPANDSPTDTMPVPRPVRAGPVEPAATDDVAAIAASPVPQPPREDAVPVDTAPGVARAPAPAPAPAIAPVPAAEPDPPAAARPPATEPPVLALADLTADERRALPPLKLSMHMWAPAPADRFVILDGHRLGEGDRAGNAVIERIDPDGVILAADGRRVRLPLP